MKRQINRFVAGIMFMAMLTGCGQTDTTETTNVDLNKVQRVSYDASEEYEEALQTYNKGCDPAKVVRDDPSVDGKKVALILQGAEDNVIVEKAIELLEDHNIKASFAVTAMEAAEDDNTLKLIMKKGHDVIDNGLIGADAEELSTGEDLIYNLTASKKVFSTLMDFGTDKLLLNSTAYTDSVCMAAKASGYEKLIAPSSGKFLNVKSFKDSENCGEYVGRLQTGSILVFKLNGIIDAIEMEPKVEARKPAIDMQPTTDADGKEDDEVDSITVLSWLLDALDSQQFKVIKTDALKAISESEYLDSLLSEYEGLEADTYDSIETMESVSGLSFYGINSDANVMDSIIDKLLSSESNATFFISGKDLENYPETAEKIADAGFSIATSGYIGEDLSGKDTKEIYEDISGGIRAIQRQLLLKAKHYMPKGNVDKNILKAAAIAGVSVITPKTPNQADKGKINCFDLTREFDEKAFEAFIEKSGNSGITLVDVSDLIKTANSLPEINDDALAELRESNGGKYAGVRNMVYTSEKAMTFVFYGVTNRRVLEDVLGILNKKGYKSTFFVTSDEMVSCSEQIKSILASGCEIGIAYIDRTANEEIKDPTEEGDDENRKDEKTADSAESTMKFNAAAKYILGAQKFLSWKYGVDSKLVMQPYGEISSETKEAVSATGCAFVGYEYAMVQSKYADATDVGSFYSKLSEKIDPHRGSIAYFHMNYFSADKDAATSDGHTLLGNLVNKFISNEIATLTYQDVYGQYQGSTAYTVKTFSSLSYSKFSYSPGRGGQSQVADGRNVLGNMSSAEEQNNYMASRYIGNPDVSVLPGFTTEDMKKFDTTGNVTNQKVLFLTFDDWGYEKNINELLYVLNKYGVKGNFFVRTNNVKNNPNLLRAIAMDGHMIGSHSNSHMAAWYVTADGQGGYQYTTLTPEDAAKLRSDVVTSYGILNKYIGDVNVGGKPALSSIYRPPTLAVSREGMYQIMDVGYSYIVNGDFSTADYGAESVDALVSELRNGKSTWYGKETVNGGSCLVMHMSPEAQYTAEALDIMIPEWLSQGYSIARLDDYLK